MSKRTGETTTSANLVARFEAGDAVMDYFKMPAAVAAGVEGRINVDMSSWMYEAVRAEAQRSGLSCQAVVKWWLSERISAEARRDKAEPAREQPTSRSMGQYGCGDDYYYGEPTF
ncbi:MAG: hypothetical protein PHR15_03815 [Atopobiaceae bacterium]|nr:hypothetical protein [Atopobiaceae bacterium]MCH4180158.1 hypothetical protein [Atopobiaceae bacterium]MCH4214328.1 hypothetical protein [Atopobiaceae bacterium]MCI1227016.1 hypothetical protein [Atopobiaceae bacterium]MCI1260495.1 hypothetical protein [Atopobiaceae bacterium]